MNDAMSNAPPLARLLELSRRARLADDVEELAFLAVNDTHDLAPYRQAVLWFAGAGIKALSGVVEPEANAPYAHFIEGACRALDQDARKATTVTAADLPEKPAAEWSEWLPTHGLWLPFGTAGDAARGGLLLAADRPWSEDNILLLEEWAAVWHHAWLARAAAAPWHWLHWRRMLGAAPGLIHRPWWKRRGAWFTAVVGLTLLLPVRISVLAPGELVPGRPAVIRAPLDGVIGQFSVQPNQTVKPGQLLFTFDEASADTRSAVAGQALAAAEAEYRQAEQMALSDSRSKAQLAQLSAKVGEKRAEAAFYVDQTRRARVLAPEGGVALLDDPSEWIGKAVQTGERIMRIAVPGDVEIEAWLPIGDAIPLAGRADATLYLASRPLDALPAKVRYVAHDAVVRPDGTYAYRVRATLDAPTSTRVGLKGTVKLAGERVPLAYWILRRPLATIRQTLGI
ncbi:efflux RND transporter periplasmic adaptor subunit [Massilia phyllosphaerae]|uniref:efflux RND transporter periplasmic adaptor subunit n=1 Tax=Massilia phyllosphaerae TaxID=3106034 RepID=UPI002B1CDADA|nr:HlyD family efflux transporter periplasmic adaptor subunit [Massilia sp. SGZ-792]